MLTDLVQMLLDVLFPPRCVSCGEAGAVLCATCLATARAPQPPLCGRCGRPLPSDSATCSACASGFGPTGLVSLRAAAVYEGAVRAGVLALKYKGQRRLAGPLGALLAQAVRDMGNSPDVIVPVPLHAARRRQRGYNQAELLARGCASRLDIPCEANALVRHRATPPQVGLPSAERRTNVSGAFALASPVAAKLLSGKRVLLVDDVTTTGSTLDSAAAALLAARPAEVRGVALTRPDLGDDSGDISAPTTRDFAYKALPDAQFRRES